MEAVRALNADYSRRRAAGDAGSGVNDMPLVVNSDGWVRGMGLELLGVLIRILGTSLPSPISDKYRLFPAPSPV